MAKKIDTIELFIDEEKLNDGIDAISLVKFPAIEENWIALNQHKIEFKTVDEDKRIIIGLALIPDKEIYRRNKDYEYNITFSKDTVKRCSELYLKRLKNNNATLEHETNVEGVSLAESWIVEDLVHDKTALYKLNATLGSWAVALKVDNDEVWQDVKNGTYQGFSIEGFFSEKAELNIQPTEEEILIEKLKEIIIKNKL